MNVINSKTEGDSNIVQNLFRSDIKITYKEILKQVDRDYSESESQEIKTMLEEIKNKLNSRQIPDSGLLEKLKKYEPIYTAFLPIVMKGIELAKFFGALG